MRTCGKSWTLVVMLFLAALPAAAKKRQARQSTSWREQAARLKLSRKTIARLDNNGLVLTHTVYKQVFEPYLKSGERALFITSDSILVAWRVLLEESLRHYENRRAELFPRILRRMLTGLPAVVRELRGRKDATVRKTLPGAERRVRLVLGVALRLLDPAFRLNDRELDDLVTAEVARIEAGRGGVHLPEWLGPRGSDFEGLDYMRFEPCGFYAESDLLRRYFRAVAWLQTVPFRGYVDQELLAVMLLAKSTGLGAPLSASTTPAPETAREETTDFLFGFRDLLGPPPDDLTLVDAANTYDAAFQKRPLGSRRRGAPLETARRTIRAAAKKRPVGLINDQMRYPPESGKGPMYVFRIMPAYRTPGGVLFHTSVNGPGGSIPPSGLEVAAALGSEYALRETATRLGASALRSTRLTRKYFEVPCPATVNDRFLYALRALVASPDADAPDFMKTPPWAVKSCNTVLAGWAQMRHAWTLQAKPSADYMALCRPPAGFVEPCPLFFARMAVVGNSAFRMFHETGALDLNIRQHLPSLRKLHGALLRIPGKRPWSQELGYEDHTVAPDLPSADTLSLIWHAAAGSAREAVLRRDYATANRTCARNLAQIIRDLEKTGLAHYPKLAVALRKELPDLTALWSDFSLLCAQLGGLAEKELRERPFGDDEERLIRGFGTRLAGLMLYAGNSYLTPRDDAPVIVDLHAGASAGKPPDRLHVGTARPRRLLVLFPWQGKRLLCVGAVVPYCEFVDTKRVTDAEWRERLDHLSRPPIPDWLAGF